jgi:hypothetical protein
VSAFPCGSLRENKLEQAGDPLLCSKFTDSESHAAHLSQHIGFPSVLHVFPVRLFDSGTHVQRASPSLTRRPYTPSRGSMTIRLEISSDSRPSVRLPLHDLAPSHARTSKYISVSSQQACVAITQRSPSIRLIPPIRPRVRHRCRRCQVQVQAQPQACFLFAPATSAERLAPPP